MDSLEEETVDLMRKRVYDMAGMLGKTVKVRARSWESVHMRCSSGHTGTSQGWLLQHCA
jgi:hypothetical protein